MNHSVLPSCTNAVEAREAAEAYVLKRLSVTEFEHYEEHLIACARCQDAVQEFDLFLSTARAALAQYPEGRPRRRSSKQHAKSASG
jgi:anti-sigma factor RsiW